MTGEHWTQALTASLSLSKRCADWTCSAASELSDFLVSGWRTLTPEKMKFLYTIMALLALAHATQAGESSLTITYQPLDGLGAGRIFVHPVTCHDWYSSSGQATAIGLISAPNIPPTNNKQATEDLNLASVCGVKFYTSDLGHPKAALSVTMDCRKFLIPKRSGYPRKEIIRACLECLRRCLPDKLLKTRVTLKATEVDLNWMRPIIEKFNEHDRSKPFKILGG